MPLDKTPWNGDTRIPWGKHKGERLTNVPGEYLLWYYEQPWAKDWPGLYAYVKEIHDALQENVDDGMGHSVGEMESWDDYMDSI